ncbi:C4-dicarboxylate TRAP transporter substrate-binding protein [Marinobacter sp. OP 3.4]|uniref:C4-dicarboxylate TRAP transporter substrate-binding protein n=1 Tax=Marinobacter sp. OP 3.4 TaxID=3076501 RepID=UPI002E1A2E94
MTFLKTITSFAAPVVLGSLLFTAGASAETITHATGYPPNTIGANGAETFAGALEELSGGEMDAKVYASSLLSFSETSPGIRDGMADSGFVLMSYYPKEFPVSNLAAELSMLVKLDDVQDSTAGLAFMGALADFVFNYCDECVDEFAAQNQVFTSASASDNYMLQCNKPVTNLAQMEGKRIRTSGPHWARWVEHLGGTPVTMSVSDQYEALNQGVLDCTISSGIDMDIFKIKEVVTDLTPGVPGGVYGATAFNNINRDVWKGLTEDERRNVLHASAIGAARVSMDYHIGAAREMAAADSRDINVHEPSEELLQATQAFIKTDIPRIASNYTERHGVEAADEKVAKFRELLAKWSDLVRDVDSADALAEIYWDELYSKVDVSSYAL